MKPLAGFVSLTDRRTHAQKNATTFFRRGFCGNEVLERDTIPLPVFIVYPRAPLCVACVTEIEKEIR